MKSNPSAKRNSVETERRKSFKEFYPYYLAEHSDSLNRVLHFVGTWVVVLVAAAALLSRQWNLLWLCPLAGYGFAWAGHFFFQKNRPATFKQPLFSLLADFVMWWHLLTRKIQF
ncbi:MAG: DUF962 domain-containing protein [Bacteriovoracaceae bacterium]